MAGKDDFGYFGEGLDGYVQYTTSFEREFDDFENEDEAYDGFDDPDLEDDIYDESDDFFDEEM